MLYFMQTHTMKLQSEPFEKIKLGMKKIELRLYDEKRRAIEIGDTITFLKEPDQTENLVVKVISLLRYATFADIAEDFDTKTYFGHTSKDELLAGVGHFYTEDDQKHFGVLGIRIRKL